MLTINVPIWLLVFVMGIVTGVSAILALGVWLGRKKQRKPTVYTIEQVRDAFRGWCHLGPEFGLYTDEWWEAFETQLVGSNEVTR